jgi:hypothetical protein
VRNHATFVAFPMLHTGSPERISIQFGTVIPRQFQCCGSHCSKDASCYLLRYSTLYTLIMKLRWGQNQSRDLIISILSHSLSSTFKFRPLIRLCRLKFSSVPAGRFLDSTLNIESKSSFHILAN